MKNEIAKNIAKVKEVIAAEGVMAAAKLAKELFNVSDENISVLHGKCQYSVYMYCYMLKISARKNILIAFSQLGETVEICQGDTRYHELEYDARAKFFGLAPRVPVLF
jgi:hypothetical protein